MDDDELTPQAFGLTPRQIVILQGIADGEPLGIVAERLCVARTTVSNEISRAIEALSAKTKSHAVAAALRKGFID